MSTLLAKDQQVIVALRTRPFLASEHPPPQLALDDQQPPSTAVENDFGPPVAEEESERTRGVSVQGEETMVVHLPVKKVSLPSPLPARTSDELISTFAWLGGIVERCAGPG